jgi:hypothetical protein
MSTETSKAQDVVSAGLIARPTSTEAIGAGGVFTATCVGADGQVKWTEEFHNLVVNEGLQNMNQTYFKGSGYTAAWYCVRRSMERLGMWYTGHRLFCEFRGA